MGKINDDGNAIRSKTRIQIIDILKAVAIVSIVAGHAPTSTGVTKFVYAYHLMAFFFAAGMSLRPDRLKDWAGVCGYVGRAVVKELGLFFLYACVFGSLHNIFLKMGIYETTAYKLPNVIKSILLSFAFYGTEQYMGAFWFFPCILVAMLISAILLYCAERSPHGAPVRAALLFFSAAFALYLYSSGFQMTYYLQVAFLGVPILIAGHFCMKHWDRIAKYITWYGGVASAVLIIVILKATGKMVELSVNEIISLPLFYPVTFLGIYFCLAVSRLLEDGPAGKLAAFIGKNSFHIMALHFLAFKLLDYCYVTLAHVKDGVTLSRFPSSHCFPGYFYIIWGIAFSVTVVRLVGYLMARIRGKSLPPLGLRETFNKAFLLRLPVCALPVFTVLFFAPLEVFFGNTRSFDFSIQNVWWFLLLLALLISFLIDFFITAAPERIRWVLYAGILGAGLASYLQALLMNGKMISMTGDTADYSTAVIWGNSAIWLILIVGTIAVYRYLGKRKKRGCDLACILIAGTVLIMQTAGLVSILLDSRGTRANSSDAFLTYDGEFMLSNNENVVVFLLDTADGSYMEAALKDDPALLDGLDGFTYYPDCVSTFSRTYPSVPYLLTQEKCYFNLPYEEYVDSAFEGSSFWRELADHCDDIRLFTGSSFIGDDAMDDINNIACFDFSSASSVDLRALATSMEKIGMYRSMPYAKKNDYIYDPAVINAAVARNYASTAYQTNDEAFCQSVLSNAITVDTSSERAFRFYHLFGPHPGNYLDENCNRVQNPTASQTLRGDFKMIKSYISQMKELGIYQKSTIIIMTDHGIVLNGSHLRREGPAVALMLVKPSNAESAPCQISSAQVSHEDWFSTIIAAVGGDYTKYGSRIYDVQEGEQRERIHYYTTLYSDIDGEIALREYRILGDARVFSNWSLTGRNWDIRYSQRTVSKHRLWDEEPDAQIITES